MNSEPKYKVLSTVNINGRKFEFRQYENEYHATEVCIGGEFHRVCNSYQSALMEWTRLINS